MTKNSATIMAVKSNALPASILKTGFHKFHFQEIYDIIDEAGVWWGKRGDLETDPTFKQIIPYVIIRSGDKYASYVRGTSGSEDRLHGRVSIGVGGHIDLPDCVIATDENGNNKPYTDIENTLLVSVNRELQEEIRMSDDGVENKICVPAGFIYEDKTEIGLVHIGVICEISLSEDAIIESNEPDLVNVELKTKEELLSLGDRLELWTRIYLENQS